MIGILNIKKTQGITSRDAVNHVQRLVKPDKVGHAGTLDPLATGVLLVCVGKATRLMSILQKTSKTYEAEFTLGQQSDTDDSTGVVKIADMQTLPSRASVESALETFVGEIQQVPPAYSAVKVQGRRAYSKARQGENVTLAARPVMVEEIEILGYDFPVLNVRIRCGSGTYIRSIARDLGHKLGCGGLMSALVRTAIGEFKVQDAIDSRELTPENLPRHLQNPVASVSHFPIVLCSSADETNVASGRPVHVAGGLQTNGFDCTALVSEDRQRLLALGEYQPAQSHVQPRTVFI